MAVVPIPLAAIKQNVAGETDEPFPGQLAQLQSKK